MESNVMPLDGLDIPYETLVVKGNIKIITRRGRKHPLSNKVWVICQVKSNRMIGKPFKNLSQVIDAFKELTRIIEQQNIEVTCKIKPDHPDARVILDWVEWCNQNNYF